MASKLHPGPTVGLRDTTPALRNATLTPPSRGTTAWCAAAYPPNPNPNPDPDPDHGLARHREDSGLQPYGTRLQPYAAGLQPYAAGLQPLASRLQPYVVRLQPYVVRLQPHAPRRVAAEDTGLLSATAWDPRSYARYSFPHAIWTAEIRFPIRATPGYATRGGGYPYP